MSRRTITLTVAGILLLLLVAVAAVLPVPFVTFSPGPVENTLGRVHGRAVIEISGHPTYPTRGQLDLTTASVTSPGVRVSLPQVLVAWFDPHRAVLPRAVVYPPGQSVNAVQQENAQEMQTSQQTAVVAALRLLGLSVPRAVVVHSIVKGAPALGHLQAGDVIRVVNGRRITDVTQVSRALQRTTPGRRASFVVERGNRRVHLRSPTEHAPGKPSHTLVGITVAPGFDLPFDVRIRLGADIGGPSAGLMFALGIYDKLTPGALTHGAKIAGTGEITPNGRVHTIGGIQQKLAASVDAGVSLFFVPAANCGEAVNAGIDQSQMRLVRVSTLRGAVTALRRWTGNHSASLPSCS